MGKRGPKPNPIRMAQLSAKIQKSTHDALVEMGRKNQRNTSRELEVRLLRSFAEDKRLDDQGGGRTPHAIGNMIAVALEVAGDIAVSTRTGKLGSPGAWLHDAYSFDQAFRAAMTVLEQFRPPGDPSPPKARSVFKAHGKNVGAVKNRPAMEFALAHLGAAIA